MRLSSFMQNTLYEIPPGLGLGHMLSLLAFAVAVLALFK